MASLAFSGYNGSGLATGGGVFVNIARTALALLLAAQAAGALEEVWHCDTWSAARSLPAVADVDGDGDLEVLFSTRLDGTLWVVGSDGAVEARHRHPFWLEGGVAVVSSDSPDGRHEDLDSLLRTGEDVWCAFQESSGRVYRRVLGREPSSFVMLAGNPCIGTAPCFADLDGDGAFELLVTRRDGICTALDGDHALRWQFDAGAPFDSSPAVLPLDEPNGGRCAVLLSAADGVLHALTGAGEPRWQFSMNHSAARFPSKADPVAVQFGETASVLVSDAAGWLYAVDALTGREQWRRSVGERSLGTPAVVDVDGVGGPEVVVLGETGAVAVIGSDGRISSRARLPEGRYVPRPLVADVDGDGHPEVLAATGDWSIAVVSLDGRVEEIVALQGNALEGLVLANVVGDERLELLAATECARLHCFATEATTGWTHPRGGFALNGCAAPAIIGSLSAVRPTGIAAKPRSVTIPARRRTVMNQASDDEAVSEEEEAVPDRPIAATAVVSFREPPDATRVTAIVRRDGVPVGSANKVPEEGFTIPFVQQSDGELTLDIVFHSKSGHLAGVAGIPLAHREGDAGDLSPSQAFLDALSERADAYEVPDAWGLPEIHGRNSWHVARYMPAEVASLRACPRAVHRAGYPEDLGPGSKSRDPLQFRAPRVAGYRDGRQTVLHHERLLSA